MVEQISAHGRSAHSALLHRVRRARPWLGTLVEIDAEGASRDDVEDGVAAAFAVIARIHEALSVHDPSSELSRVNRAASRCWQPVSSHLRAVLSCALEIAAQSRGAFDPTIGGRLAALGLLPPQGHAHAAATWRDVALESRGVHYARPLRLDLGGIAKGYAVDCAIAALRAHEVTVARVNAGGDLRVIGPAPHDVHVRTGGPQRVLLPLASVVDGAVATSAFGGTRRRIGGRWVTPLIDPVAGLPVMSTRTVSVIASTCMVADALTKVVALRGRAASAIVARHDAAAAIFSPAAGRWRCTRLPQHSGPTTTQRDHAAHG